MQTAEALQSQIDFEPAIAIDLYDFEPDYVMTTEFCALCDGDHDHTEMIYCDSCDHSYCEECFELHLRQSEECRMRNGAD